MKRNVIWRGFEERDLDFVYRCKNDKSLSKLSLNGFQPISYEEVAGWIEKCVHDDGTYKYWVICTDDEFQNIVGWCSISQIDFVEKKASIHGITIANARYRDGSALFSSVIHMVDYVFETLGLDRIDMKCLSGQLNSRAFLDLVLQKNERIDEKVVCRDGVCHDVVSYSIHREEYELLKKNGLVDFDVCVSKLKDQKRNNMDISNVTLDVFLEYFKSVLTETDPADINEKTKFIDLEEWSSLFAIEVAAVVESVCKVRLGAYDLQSCDTIEDLYRYAMREG